MENITSSPLTSRCRARENLGCYANPPSGLANQAGACYETGRSGTVQRRDMAVWRVPVVFLSGCPAACVAAL
jgi:hypothetical protein